MTPKLRALVVDDEPAILRFLQAALGASDYVVSSAATVQEALKGMGDNPDIVILDLGLPDGDGKDVIREIRRSSNVPIVVLSARDREAEKIEALGPRRRRLRQQAFRRRRAHGAVACRAASPP